MVRNFASELAHESVGETWVTDFLDRNSNTLLLKWTSAVDKVRYAADNSKKYKAYFTLLHTKITQYNVRAADT